MSKQWPEIVYYRALGLWCSDVDYARELDRHFADREPVGDPETARLVLTGAHVFSIIRGRFRTPPED